MISVRSSRHRLPAAPPKMIRLLPEQIPDILNNPLRSSGHVHPQDALAAVRQRGLLRLLERKQKRHQVA